MFHIERFISSNEDLKRNSQGLPGGIERTTFSPLSPWERGKVGKGGRVFIDRPINWTLRDQPPHDQKSLQGRLLRR